MDRLVEKYRPRKIESFAGLKTAKTLMGKLAKSPWESSWLFVGDSGTGKTSLAFALAAELGAEVHHVPSSRCDKAMVEEITQKCWYTPMFGTWHLVIVDEADAMSVAAQLAFLSVLDGSGHFPPKTIFIFTANSDAKLEKRFKSRCKVIQFDGMVDAAELGDFLYDVWMDEAPTWATAPLMHKVFAESEGNVRAALEAVEMELLMLPANRPNRSAS